jgi:hypothetical protein
MRQINKTVFISYRRNDHAWAELIYRFLTSHGFDVFVDIHGLASGDFEHGILANIESRDHFVVLLTPNALARCNEPEDLFRRETQAAMRSRRNVVPLLLNGFSFSAPGIADQLGDALAHLRHYNGLVIPPGYVEQAMERLLDFVNVALDEVQHPAEKATSEPPPIIPIPVSERPEDSIVCLVARMSMMTMLPISIPPHSTAYILPLSDKPQAPGLMEIGNSGNQFSRWPDPTRTNGSAPELALGCTLSNAIDKALVNVRLIFRVNYRIPRPGGGIVAADPIACASYPRVAIPLIHPYKTFQFVIANRSQTHAAEVSLPQQAVIQIAGESAQRRILITRPEVSILDMLASNVLSPTHLSW